MSDHVCTCPAHAFQVIDKLHSHLEDSINYLEELQSAGTALNWAAVINQAHSMMHTLEIFGAALEPFIDESRPEEELEQGLTDEEKEQLFYLLGKASGLDKVMVTMH